MSNQTCSDCPKPIKGDHVTEDGDRLHVRCSRKRIEGRPNFIRWEKTVTIGASSEVEAVQ